MPAPTRDRRDSLDKHEQQQRRWRRQAEARHICHNCVWVVACCKETMQEQLEAFYGLALAETAACLEQMQANVAAHRWVEALRLLRKQQQHQVGRHNDAHQDEVVACRERSFCYSLRGAYRYSFEQARRFLLPAAVAFENGLCDVSHRRCDSCEKSLEVRVALRCTWRCAMSVAISYDVWKRARSPDDFEKLTHCDRKEDPNDYCHLWNHTIKHCKNIQYSPIAWLYLTMLGGAAAVYAMLCDTWVVEMSKLHQAIAFSVGTEPCISGLILWTGWSAFICVIASTICYFVPVVQGSGIPLLRALFAGVYQNPGSSVLAFRTFLYKTVATSLTSASGLSLGRLGPFSHAIPILGYHLGQLGIFRRVEFGPSNFNYLRAAIACGIASCFGTPLGGVLYSIEVTAKSYDIKCLWEGMVSSSVCVLVFTIITFLKHKVLFERTAFPAFDVGWDPLTFILLGAVMGIIAGLYCKCAVLLHYVQGKLFDKFELTNGSFRRRMVHVLSVCIATAVLTYPFYIIRLSDLALVNEVFHDQPLSLPQWTQFTDTPQLALIFYIMVKFFITILVCGAPLSFGVFGPLFTVGAAMGRLYGEILTTYWDPTFSPAAYAVVGAACFSASVTATVSTCVIFFEVTGQISHLIPVMLACVVAYFICGIISPSIYDVMAGWSGLNAVCYDFNDYIMDQKLAEDYMSPIKIVLTKQTTYAEALKILTLYPLAEYFPIVDGKDNRFLIAAVRRQELEVGIARFFAMNPHAMGENEPTPKMAAKIAKLVSATVHSSRSSAVELDVVPLLNDSSDVEEDASTSTLQWGPPIGYFTFASIPVESCPPQVGNDASLNRVNKLASMYMWTTVYVVRCGRLVGEINLEESLSQLKREDPRATKLS